MPTKSPGLFAEGQSVVITLLVNGEERGRVPGLVISKGTGGARIRVGTGPGSQVKFFGWLNDAAIYRDRDGHEYIAKGDQS